MRQLLTLFLIVAATGFIPGCSEKNATGSEGNYRINGTWDGRTSSNDIFYFKVEDNWIRQINLPPGTYTSSMISPIEDNAFTYSTGNFQMTGYFTSSKSANGTFRNGAVQGTWTAAKR